MNNIEVFYEDIIPLKLSAKILQKYINGLIDNELKDAGEITVVLCSDAYLLEMNRQYLEHDFYTDIITFDYVVENTIAGDLFISYERVKENAAKYKVKTENELLRVIFHGVLHLIGYKDKETEEKKLMRQKEDYYLSEVDFEEIEL